MALLDQITERTTERDAVVALVRSGARPGTLACDLSDVTPDELARLPRQLHATVAATGTVPATLAVLAADVGRTGAAAAARPGCPADARLAHLEAWLDWTHAREDRDQAAPVLAALARDDADAAVDLLTGSRHLAGLARTTVAGLADDPATLAAVWQRVVARGHAGREVAAMLGEAVADPDSAVDVHTALALLEAGVRDRHVAVLAVDVDRLHHTVPTGPAAREVAERALALVDAGVITGPVLARGRLPLVLDQVDRLLADGRPEALTCVVRSAGRVGDGAPARQLAGLLAAVDALRTADALNLEDLDDALRGVAQILRVREPLTLDAGVCASLRRLLDDRLTLPATRRNDVTVRSAARTVAAGVADLHDAAGLLEAVVAHLQEASQDPARLAEEHVVELLLAVRRYHLPTTHPVWQHLDELAREPAVFTAADTVSRFHNDRAYARALTELRPGRTTSRHRDAVLAKLVAQDLSDDRLPSSAVSTLLQLIEDGWDSTYTALVDAAARLHTTAST